MKKWIALALIIACVLGMAGCAEKNAADVVETTPPATVDNDAVLKAELLEKYGAPFLLRRTEGMALWYFTLSETGAERAYLHSMEGETYHKSLTWEIKNGELVISGDWNETFTLNIAENQVISRTDEAVYNIIESE